MKHARPDPTAPKLPAAARNALMHGRMFEAVGILRDKSRMSADEANKFIAARAEADPALARGMLEAYVKGVRSLRIAAMAMGGVMLVVFMYVLILRLAP